MSLRNVSLASMLCLAAIGCSGVTRDVPPPRDIRASLSASSRDTALRLVAFAPSDTLRLADSLRVVVALYNGGSYWDFPDDCYAFSFDVLTDDGTPVKADPLPQVFGMCKTFPLLRGEFKGFTQRLACDRPEPADPRHVPECWWNFRLAKPGRYRIVAHYKQPQAPDRLDSRRLPRTKLLTSDTVAIEFRPR